MDVLIKRVIDTEAKTDNVFLNKGHIYTFLNPVSYLDARKNKELFCQFDGIFADGSLMVGAIRLLYGEKIVRRSFDMTSLAHDLFAYVAEHRLSIYVVASTSEEVERTVSEIQRRYPGIIIKGYRSGFFHDTAEQDDAIRSLVESSSDYLVVGMGAIKQEQFLLKAKNQGFKGIGFTCGGFISQTAKNMDKIDYYPKWIDKNNLRFIYRMYKEPHTRKRYLKAGILFPIAMIASKIGGNYRCGGYISIAIEVLLPVNNQLRRAA